MKQEKSFFKPDPDEKVDLIARAWIAATIWIMVIFIAIIMMKVSDVHLFGSMESDTIQHETQSEIHTSLGTARSNTEPLQSIDVYRLSTEKTAISDTQILFFFENDLPKFPVGAEIFVELSNQDAYVISSSGTDVTYGRFDATAMDIIHERAEIHVDIRNQKVVRKIKKIKDLSPDSYLA